MFKVLLRASDLLVSYFWYYNLLRVLKPTQKIFKFLGVVIIFICNSLVLVKLQISGLKSKSDITGQINDKLCFMMHDLLPVSGISDITIRILNLILLCFLCYHSVLNIITNFKYYYKFIRQVSLPAIATDFKYFSDEHMIYYKISGTTKGLMYYHTFQIIIISFRYYVRQVSEMTWSFSFFFS